jgi:hypothetical protein
MIDPNWRCPVCDAASEWLIGVDGMPEAARCGVCNFPFSLPSHSQPVVPLPAHNDFIMAKWKESLPEDV